jgi:hypothetical protein
MSKDASVNGSWTDRGLRFTRTAVSRHESDLERIALAVPSCGRKYRSERGRPVMNPGTRLGRGRRQIVASSRRPSLIVR